MLNVKCHKSTKPEQDQNSLLLKWSLIKGFDNLCIPIECQAHFNQ